MKILELKHVAPYLEHEVYAYNDEQYSKMDKIVGVFRDNLDFENWSPINSKIENYKLVLHPLSDLNNPIEHNGKKFVPVEYFEIGDDDNHCIEYDYGNIKLIKTLEDISKCNLKHDINFLPYSVVKNLLEWHFDIYLLIDAGLAIDVNTLKTNPYK